LKCLVKALSLALELEEQLHCPNKVGTRSVTDFLIRIPKGFVVGGVVIGGVGTARRMTELTRRSWHTGAKTLARIRVGWPCSLASIPR